MGRSGAEGRDGPDVLRFLVAEDVALAGGEKDPEEGEAGGIPGVFDGDLEGLIVEQDSDRTLVGFVAAIAFDAERQAGREFWRIVSHKSGI
jgi:hypothetical protein